MLVRSIIVSAYVALLLGASGSLYANPKGATVVHGSASFSQPNANTLNIRNSRNAIINWQQFGIGAGQTTRFIQPGKNSAVLNRVIGNNPSKIFGNLRSNGRVFLINQHGLMVGEGAQINTNGFFGSTLNITNEDFLKGKLKFSGGGLGGIENQGYIHAGDNGHVVLIAPDIENGGVISTDGGNILLAAGQSITITSLNDASIEFEVQSPDNTVTNLGSIVAKNGAAGIFAGSLKHSGSINATGLVRDADGTIRLVAKDSIEVTGEVSAGSSALGGRITLEAEQIALFSGTNISASGTDAGGEILVGGDQQGLNPEIKNATSVTLDEGATVSADASQAGDGGRVILFAENDLHVHGELTAKGGAASGDGGFIETSGIKQLDITSLPDATAANGKGGEWLIDPENINITNTQANITQTPGTDGGSAEDFAPTADDTATTIDVSLINAALNNGLDVTVSTTSGGTDEGNITISAIIQKNSDLGLGDGSTLTLNADNDININADIRSTNGALNMVLNADDAGGGVINLGSVILDANGGSINTGNETLVATGGTSATISAASMALDSLTVTNSSISLNTNLTVSNNLNLTGATFTGTGQLTAQSGSTTTISSNGFNVDTNFNSGFTFLNEGALTWSASDNDSDINVAGSLVNGASGTMTISVSSGSDNHGIEGTGTFTNSGTLDLNVDRTVPINVGDFTNDATGAVNINQGTLIVRSPGTDPVGGSYTVASGATLEFELNDGETRDTSSDISGAGDLLFDSPNFAVTNDFIIRGDINITGTTTTNEGNANTTTVDISNGTVTSFGSSLTHEATTLLLPASANLSSLVTLTTGGFGGDLSIPGGASVPNLTTIDVGSGTLTFPDGIGFPSLNSVILSNDGQGSAGTLDLGNLTSTLDLTMTNGTLTNDGTISLASTNTLIGATLSGSGQLTIPTGITTTIDSNGFTVQTTVDTGFTLQNEGSLVWAASDNGADLNVNGSLVNAATGTLTISVSSPSDNQGFEGTGNFTNSGTLDLNVDRTVPINVGDFTNDATGAVNINQGTLIVRSPGTDPVGGSYTVASGATLEFELNDGETRDTSSDISGAGDLLFDSPNFAVTNDFIIRGDINITGTTTTNEGNANTTTVDISNGTVTSFGSSLTHEATTLLLPASANLSSLVTLTTGGFGGDLSIPGGASVPNLTTIDVGSGTLTFPDGIGFPSLNSVILSNDGQGSAGTLDLGNLTSTLDLTMTNGTLTNDGTISLASTNTLIGATLSGSGQLTIPTGITTTIDSNGFSVQTTVDTGFTLQNEGSLVWAASDNGADLNVNGSLVNAATGTLTISVSSPSDNQGFEGTGNFTNSGTLDLNVDRTVPINVGDFTNDATGAVNINQGTLIVRSPGTDPVGGSYTVVSGSTLEFELNNGETRDTSSDISGAGDLLFDSPNFAVTNDFIIRGDINITGTTTTTENSSSASTVDISNGTVTSLGSNLSVGGDQLILPSGGGLTIATATITNGGGLDTNGDLTITGALNLVNGDLTVGGDVNVGGVTTWSPNAFTIDGTGRLLANGGFDAPNLTNDTLTLNAELVIGAASTWSLTGGGFVGAISGDANGLITNNSTVDIDTGAGLFTISVDVNNAGTIVKSAGTSPLRLTDNLVNDGAALIDIDSGTLELVTTTGTYTGSFDIAAGATLDLEAGTQTFAAGANLLGAGAVTNTGATTDISASNGFASTTVLSVSSGSVALGASTPTMDTISISNTGSVTTTANLAVTSSVTINGASASLDVGGTLAVPVLNLTRGALTLAGDATVSGLTTWGQNNFTINGPGRLLANGGFDAQNLTNDTLTLNTELVIGAASTWSLTGGGFVGAIAGDANGVISNNSDIDIDTGAGLFTISVDVNNAGSITKSAGTSPLRLTDNLINNGAALIDIDAGTLELVTTTGTYTGSFDIAAGATLDLEAGTQTFASGANLLGAGAVTNTGATTDISASNGFAATTVLSVSSGSVALGASTSTLDTLSVTSSGSVSTTANLVVTNAITINGASASLDVGGTLAVPVLNLSRGSITLGGDATVSGLTTWGPDNFTINGPGRLLANGGFDAPNLTNDTLTLNTELVLGAASTWSLTGGGFVGAVGGDANGLITNNSTLDIDTAAGLFTISIDINNAGTLIKSAGTSPLRFTDNLTNDGAALIDIDSGTLEVVTTTGTYTGNFDVAAGATLDLETGTQTFASGATLLGAGTVTNTGATTDVSASSGFTASTLLSVSSGSVGLGASTPTIDTLSVTSSGSVATTANLAVTNVITINGASASINVGGTLAVPVLNLSRGALTLSGDATVSGLTTWGQDNFTINGPGRLLANGGLDAPNLTNDTLTLNTELVLGGASTWSLAGGGFVGAIAGDANGLITNNGTLDIDTAAGLFTISIEVNNTGTIDKSAGTSTLDFTDSLTNTGTLNVASGAIRTSEVLSNPEGAVLSGSGTFIALAGISNAGTIRPGGQGSIGGLTISGDLTTTGVVEIEVSDTGTAGVNYDLLTADNITLGGQLQLLSLAYSPSASDPFTPIVCTTGCSGTFDAIFSIFGTSFAPTYNANDVSLLVSVRPVVTWDGGGGDNLWSNDLNWSGDTAPLITNDVDLGGNTVVVNSVEVSGSVQLTAGGSLTISGGGSLDASGTLYLNDATFTLSQGTLENATITSTGAGNIALAAGGLRFLDAVTLDIDLTIGNGLSVGIRNGLVLTPGHTITLADGGSGSFLTFYDGGQTLSGGGSIVLSDAGGTNNNLQSTGTAGTVTIADDIAISGSGVVGTNSANFFFQHDGPVTVGSGQSITFDNWIVGSTGSILVDGGTATMQFEWDNQAGAGSITLQNGASISLGGTFDSTAIDSGKLVDLDDSATVILTTGTMNLQGGSFTVTDAVTGTGDILIQGGTLTNGTLLQGGTATFNLGSGFNTFDDITLGMDFIIADTRTLRITSGLTINSGLELTLAANTGSSFLQFGNEAITIGGDGTIVLDDSNSRNNFISPFVSGGTLTFDTTLTVRGGGELSGSTAGSTDIVNNGTIVITNGSTLDFRNVTNNGNVQIADGGTLVYEIEAGVNDGSIALLGAGSSITSANLGLTNAATGVITGSGTINLGTALLVNDGVLRPGGVNTIGTLTISGDFQNNSGTIEIELQSGNSNPALSVNDVIAVSGDADFAGGNLTLLATGGYVSSPGFQFDIVTFATNVAGNNALTFTPISGDVLDPPTYGATALNITIATTNFLTWEGTGGAFVGDGVSWEDGNNWDSGVAPTLGDSVFIPGGFAIDVSSASAANGLTLAAGSSITISSNTLTLNGNSTAQGDITINSGNTLALGGSLTMDGSSAEGNLTIAGGIVEGGTISAINGGSLDVTASSTFDGVTLGSDFTLNSTLRIESSLSLADGITFDVAGNTVRFATTGVLPVDVQGGAGTATIDLNGGTLTSGFAVGGQTLQIASGITVQGSGLINQSSSATVENNGTINNNGGATLTINSNTFNNNGTVSVSGGTLTFSGANVSSSGLIDATSSTVNINATNWGNAGGTIDVTDSTLNLGGNFAIADIGTITRGGSTTINLTGNLDNTANALDLGDAGIFGTGGLASITGSISDGSVQNTNGTPLLNSSNGTFDSVDFDSDFILAGTIRIANDFTLADGSTFDANGNSLLFTTTGVLPVDVQGGAGTATIDLNGGIITPGVGVGGQTLQIASGITIQGSGTINQSSAATVENGGSIVNGTGTLTINPNTFTNTAGGSVTSTAGALVFSGANFTNAGLLDATSSTVNITATNWGNAGGTIDVTDSTLNLGGNFAIADIGTINRSGSTTINLTGNLDNTANALDLGDAGIFGTGGLASITGSISDGSVQNTNGTPLLNSSNGTFDSVDFDSDFILAGTIRIANDFTLADGSTFDANGNSLLFTTTGVLPVDVQGGAGTATIDLNGGIITPGVGVGGQTLQIASGITIQGSGTINQSSAATVENGGSIVNGTGTLTINPNTFTNTAGGTVTSTAGALVFSGANFTNAGLIDATSTTVNITASNWGNAGGTIDVTDSTLNLGGNFAIADIGTINRSGSTTINLTGNLDNTANALDLGDAGIFGTGGLASITGSISDGSVQNTNGTPLLNSVGGTFDSVDFDSDFTLTGSIRIANDFTLADGSTFDANGNSLLFTTTGVLPVDVQGGAGTATIDLNGGIITPGVGVGGQILQIASGITIQGSGTINQSSAATVENGGSIVNGTGTLTINPNTFTNTAGGSVTSTAGALVFSGANFTNAGLIDATSSTVNITATNWGNAGGTIDVTDSTLNLGGNFAIADIGTITRSGSTTINVTGNLDNTANTLDLGDAGIFGTGGLASISGSISNGSVQNTNGTPLLNSSNGTFDSVDFDSDFTLTGTIRIANDFTLADGSTFDANGNTINFTTTGVLPVDVQGGGVSATIDLNGGTMTAGVGVGGQTLQIASGIQVRGSGLINQSSAATVENNGLIFNNGGATLTINTNSFINNGTIVTSNGNLITTSGFTTNAGVIEIGASTTWSTSNTTLTNTGNLYGDGTVNLGSGTLNNDGVIEPGGPGAVGVLTIDGDFVMGAGGSLVIEVDDTGFVAGSDYDQLIVTTANANGVALDGNGALDVILLNAAPTPPGTFTVLSVTGGGTLSGFFGTESIDPGIDFPSYGPNSVDLDALIVFITWDGGGIDNNWSTVENWTGDALPLAGENVSIGDFTVIADTSISLGTLSLADTDITIAASLTMAGSFDADLASLITLNSGGLTINGTGQIDGGFTWNGGNLAGAGSLTTTGGTNILPTGTVGLNVDWTNTGTVNFINGTLQIQNGQVFTNQGTLNANGGAQVTANGGTGLETFVNAAGGDFNINAPITIAAEQFDNAGNITINSAQTLTISSFAGSQGGSWAFNDGSIVLTTGTLTIVSGFSTSGSPGASLSITGGTLSQSSGGLIALDSAVDVTLAGGTITGASDLQINGGFTWNNGSLGGTGKLITTGTTNFNGGTLTMDRDWDNDGTLNHNSGDIRISNASVLTNNGTFNAAGGTQISANGGTGTETFTNAATGQMNINSSLTVVPDLFSNAGTVTVATGQTLTIGSVSNQTGTWAFNDGTITLSALTTTLGAGFNTTSSPGATFNISGGVLDQSSGVLETIDSNVTVNLSLGSITGNDDLQIDGTLNWSGGTLAGTGMLITTGTTNFNGGTLTMDRDWDNDGTLNHNSGDIRISNASVLTNNGTFNAAGGTQISANGGTGTETFTNAATGQMNINSSLTVVPDLFSNAGTVTVATGQTLTISGVSNQTGTWAFNDGTITLSAFTTTLGAGFNTTSSPGATFNISGGVLDQSSGVLETIDSNVTVNLSLGSITGTDDLQIDGTFNWSGGTLAGTGMLITTGTTNFNGGTLTMDRDWDNDGTLNHNSGDIRISNASVLTNNGTFNAAGGTQISANGGTGTETFTNAATGQMNINSSLTVTPDLFNNAGTVTVASGQTLTISGVSNQTGTWAFNDGTITLSALTTTLGAGFNTTSSPGATFNISGGVLDQSSGVLETIDSNVTVNLLAGSITGADDLQIDGALNWTGGTLAGTGTLITAGTTTVTGGTLTMDRDWNNDGTLNHAAGDIRISNASVLTNNATYNAAGGTQISANGGTGTETFTNAATGQMNINNDLTVAPDLFNNLGTITVASGRTLTINGVSNQAGTWAFNDGSIAITGFTTTLGAGFNTTASTGATFNIIGGVLDQSSGGLEVIDANVQVSLSGGSIIGADDLQIDGTFNWSGGSLGGTGSLITTGSSILSVGVLGMNRDWTNQGTVNFIGGTLQIQNGQVFTNEGVFNANGGVQVSANGGTGVETFTNTATGQINVSAAVAIVPEQFNQNGALVLNGATLTVTNLVNDGDLSGSGTIIGNVTNNSVVQPGGVGATGILAIQGNYTQGLAGTLEIEVNDTGSSPGTHYDQLQVTGGSNATLTGTLDVSLLASTPPADVTVVDVVGGGIVIGTFLTNTIDAAFLAVPDYLSGTSVDVVLASLSPFTWIGGVDLLWSSDGNWAGGTAPGTGDAAVIPNGSGYTVTIDSLEIAGSLSLGSDASLTLDSGSDFTIETASTLDGTLNLFNGSLTVDGDLTVNGLTTFADGVSSPGAYAFTIGGTANLNANGGLDIQTGGGASTLTVSTPVTIGAGSTSGWNVNFTTTIVDGGSGSITNDGTINIGNTAAIQVQVPFTNAAAGDIDRGPSASLLAFQDTFDNAGNINVDGNVELQQNGTHSGTFQLGSATFTLDLAGGTQTFTGTNQFGGIGTLEITGATASFTSASPVTLGVTTDISNGLLQTTSANLSVNGNLKVSSGTSTLRLDVAGALNVTGDLTVAGGILSSGAASSVGGTLIWDLTGSATDTTFNGTGNLSVVTGFDINGSNGSQRNLIINRNLVLNSGSVSNWDADSGAAIQGTGTLSNAGSIFIFGDGVLDVVAPFTNASVISKSGGLATPIFTSGLTLTSGGQLEINFGSVDFAGNTLTLGPGTLLTGLDGTLANGNVVNSGGTVAPGGVNNAASFTINGDYTQGAAGTLVIEINDSVAVAGTNYDLLVISGTPSFDGTLVLADIGAYTVLNGDSLTPINYTGAPGAFASITDIASTTASADYASPNLTLQLFISGAITWNGLADGITWNNAGNWDLGVPSVASDVIIPNGSGYTVSIGSNQSINSLSLGGDATLTLASGSLTLGSDSTLSGSFTLSGGTLDLSDNTLTLNGGMNWTGASTVLTGTLVVPTGRTLAMSGTVSHVLDQTVLNNQGTVVLSAGTLDLSESAGDGGIVNNSGVFEFAGDFAVGDLIGGGFSQFNNLDGGLILKSGGGGTAVIAASLNSSNQGSVEIQSGTLDTNVANWVLGNGDYLQGADGVTYEGNVDNNAGIVRPGDTTNGLGAGTGAGVGTLNITGNYTQAGGTLQVEIDSAVSFDVLDVSGNADLAGGDLDPSLNYVPVVGDSYTVVNCGATCSNSFDSITSSPGVGYGQPTPGVLRIDSLSFFWSGGAGTNVWENPANWNLGVVPDAATDVNIQDAAVVLSVGTTVNSLTLLGDTGISFAAGGLTLTSGSLNTSGGSSLTLSGGGTVTVTGNLNANGSVQLDGAGLTVNGLSSFNNNFVQTAGTANLIGAATFNGNFSKSGGNLILESTATLNGASSTWSAGNLSSVGGTGSLVVGSGSNLVVSGNNTKSVQNMSLDVNGEVLTFTGGGALDLINGGSLLTGSGGQLVITGNGDVINSAGAGTLDITGGQLVNTDGSSLVSADLVTTGASQVNVQAGTLIINDAGVDAATYVVGGQAALTVTSNRSFTGDWTVNGTLNLRTGGTVNINASNGPLTVSNLSLDNGVTLSGNGVVVNDRLDWIDGAITSSLGTAADSLLVASGANITLPGTADIRGDVRLVGSTLDLNGNDLVLQNGAVLAGYGTIIGNIVNRSGVVRVGSESLLGNRPAIAARLSDGNLLIDGNFRQLADGRTVILVNNNGVQTDFSSLTVTGVAQLGGSLVLQFTAGSVGVVTADFTPVNFQGAVFGRFGEVIDSFNTVYEVDFTSADVSVTGIIPVVPEEVVQEIAAFSEETQELIEEVEEVKSEEEILIEELEQQAADAAEDDEEEGDEEDTGPLMCT